MVDTWLTHGWCCKYLWCIGRDGHQCSIAGVGSQAKTGALYGSRRHDFQCCRYVYPIVGDLLTFSSADMGMFIGATIHDVTQVVEAGYSVSSETGDLATLAKLVRMAILVSVMTAIPLYCRLVN